MKIEIIPTILVKNFEEVEDRIKRVEDYVNWVQLDVMDGIFVKNKTWANPQDLKNLKTQVKLEAHLMIKKPEEVIDEWLKVVDRVIVHYESEIANLKDLIKKAHKHGKQVGLALNPETHFSVVEPFLPRHGKRRGEKDLDLVLFMTVRPGWGGQKFKEWTLTKIEALRKLWPTGKIEVDGGINPETAKKTNIIRKYAFHKVIKSACQNSTKIIAVSESTKNDIIKTFHIDNDKIKVIYEAADDKIFKKEITEVQEKYKNTLDEFKFNEALIAIWELISFCDEYIEKEKPWSFDLAQDKQKQKEVISDLLLAISEITELLKPFLPETSEKILKQLEAQKSEPLFPRI